MPIYFANNEKNECYFLYNKHGYHWKPNTTVSTVPDDRWFAVRCSLIKNQPMDHTNYLNKTIMQVLFENKYYKWIMLSILCHFHPFQLTICFILLGPIFSLIINYVFCIYNMLYTLYYVKSSETP